MYKKEHKLNRKKLANKSLLAEKAVTRWLQRRGFEIIESFNKHHAGPYDIKARKGNNRWIIEVKSGKRPPINIENFRKMLDESRGYNKIGLAILRKNQVHLLEYNKMSYAGLKAAETKRKNR